MTKYYLSKTIPAFQDPKGVIHLREFSVHDLIFDEYLLCSGIVFEEEDCDQVTVNYVTCKKCYDKLVSANKFLNSIVP